MTTTYTGIDVSSDNLHIAWQDNQRWTARKITNQMPSIDAWIEQLPAGSHVVFEYTGTYSHRLAHCLSLAGRPFSIVTPGQSKGFADSLRRQAKTDQQDAGSLCLFGSSMRPDPTELAGESLHQKRQLHGRYHALKSQRQAIANQLHALSFDPRANAQVVDSLRGQMDFCQMQIDGIGQQLFDLDAQDFEAIKKQLLAVKGIGPVVATEPVVATDGFRNFCSAKQLAKFVGLAPSVSQSGTSVRKHGKIPRTACGVLRAKIHSAARSAARFNRDCHELYVRLRAKGKPYKVAIIAVAHKLLRQAFAVVKNGTTFDNDFQKTKEYSLA